MLIATHFLFGTAIYKLSNGLPNWIRILLILVGGFVSHFMLDSLSVYHEFDPTTILGIELTIIQILAIGLMWFSTGKWLSWKILAGLWAFLCWDFEWILPRHYLHLEAVNSWAPRAFAHGATNIYTVLWEVCIIVGLTLLAIDYEPKVSS